MAADRNELEDLHVALTEFWANRVLAAKNGGDALTAAEATAVAKFLKDNNVTAVISASKTGKNLLSTLPFQTEEHIN